MSADPLAGDVGDPQSLKKKMPTNASDRTAKRDRFFPKS
jgi:hypothetical protein